MKFLNQSIGSIFLAIYLILSGIGAFVPAFTIPYTILAAIAIIAGVLILIGR